MEDKKITSAMFGPSSENVKSVKYIPEMNQKKVRNFKHTPTRTLPHAPPHTYQDRAHRAGWRVECAREVLHSYFLADR